MIYVLLFSSQIEAERFPSNERTTPTLFDHTSPLGRFIQLFPISPDPRHLQATPSSINIYVGL